MTRFYRWLESMGQDPRTFWRDAIFFVIRFYVAVVIVMLPVIVISYAFKPLFPTPAPTPVSPGTKPPLPEGFWIFMVCFGLYLFLAVASMTSYLGYWYKLAKMFPAPSGFCEGQLFRFQSGSVGVSSYNNILTIRVAPQGLYLGCIVPFRFMHPPVLLPWSQIKALRQKRFLGRSSYFLTIGAPKIVTLALNNPKIIEAARPWLPDTSPPV